MFTIWMRQVLHHSPLFDVTMTLIEGFNIGVRGQKAYVVCGAGERQVYEAEPGRTEWITVVECICADGSAIHPLVIFKGETTVQTAWIPPEMDKDWSWTCNTKGWTCNKIGEEWIKRCFEPLTRAKANDGNLKRLLVVDGHGSHVTAPFIRFCIDHNILILLMPPHSSHLCQPLDVGVFSPLKLRMSQQLDEIMRFGVPSIKKFEWANCYRTSRPIAMTESNILSAWSGAGLFPFNPQKVLHRLRSMPEPEPLPASTIVATPSPPSNRFNLVPATPSQLDPTVLRSANEALLSNIHAGILDTPTQAYIPKLVSLSENLRATNVMVQRNYESLNAIVKKRREMVQGKRVVLKDQTLVTTEELYQKVRAAEEATRKRKRLTGRRKSRRVSQTTLASTEDAQDPQEENQAIMHEVIEVLGV